MHLFNTPKSYARSIITVVLMIVLLTAAVGLLGSANKITKEEQTQVLQRALNNAVVSCYAIEGRYPDTLDKVKRDYGIAIDEEKYRVNYDIFADNLMPSITVSVIEEN